MSRPAPGRARGCRCCSGARTARGCAAERGVTSHAGAEMIVAEDFSAVAPPGHRARVAGLCKAMEEADAAGYYPRLTVERPWSAHNPVLDGEFASPSAIRWYLERELGRLAAAGARITVYRGRRAFDLRDPAVAAAVDETRWDLRRKKLFLFGPERMACRSTGSGTTRGPSPSGSSDTSCSPTTGGTSRSSARRCPPRPGRTPRTGRCRPGTSSGRAEPGCRS